MMNLFMVLIPLLLLGAFYAEITVFGLHTPTRGPESPQQIAEPNRLSMRIAVSEGGYEIALGRDTREEIPLTEESDYDTIRLLNTLLNVANELREKNREIDHVEICSRPGIPYKVVVDVMDSCRAAAFRSVSLSLYSE